MANIKLNERSFLFVYHALKSERSKLIGDTTNENVELYNALYEADSCSIRNIKFKLYVLYTLKRYLDSSLEQIKHVPDSDVNDCKRAFFESYSRYASKMLGEEVGKDFLDMYSNLFNHILERNDNWEQFEKEFKHQIKKANHQISNML